MITLTKRKTLNETNDPTEGTQRAVFERRLVQEVLKNTSQRKIAEKLQVSPEAVKKALETPRVQTALADALAKLDAAAQVDADMIIAELAGIAFSKTEDFFTADENGQLVRVPFALLNWRARTAIEGVGGSGYTRYSKLKALELLGKYKGLDINRHQLTGADGEPLQVLGADVTADILREARRLTDGVLSGGTEEGESR